MLARFSIKSVPTLVHSTTKPSRGPIGPVSKHSEAVVQRFS
jgi:hypothetical protein